MPSDKKITVVDILAAKKEGRKITMLTAYDYPSAQVIDSAGVDISLVGDSLGNVVLGYANTLPVTMEEMISHTAAVARGTKRAFLVADMPFLSYHVSMEDARRNAGRMIKEGAAEAVKLEGGEEQCPLVSSLVTMGIPVMGHLGLTPQSVHRFGGFRVQGRDERSAERILNGAKALEKAGTFAIVLEGIPAELAARITAEVTIPTIGIGAGSGCDGQVLVFHDMLGIHRGFKPKFVKVYAEIGQQMENAVKEYIREVHEGLFPDESYSY